jgi:hypothetical protein
VRDQPARRDVEALRIVGREGRLWDEIREVEIKRPALKRGVRSLLDPAQALIRRAGGKRVRQRAEEIIPRDSGLERGDEMRGSGAISPGSLLQYRRGREVLRARAHR